MKKKWKPEYKLICYDVSREHQALPNYGVPFVRNAKWIRLCHVFCCLLDRISRNFTPSDLLTPSIWEWGWAYNCTCAEDIKSGSCSHLNKKEGNESHEIMSHNKDFLSLSPFSTMPPNTLKTSVSGMWNKQREPGKGSLLFFLFVLTNTASQFLIKC